MSFYGKIYTAVGEAFKRIKFINSGKDNTEIPTDLENDFILEAKSADDNIYLHSGNRWIGFKGADDNGLIYHLGPGDSSETIEVINDITQEADYDTLISWGDIITIQSPMYDETGHLSGSTTKKYKLEEVPEVSEVADAVNSIKDLNTVVGLPLPEGEELPDTSLLARMTAAEEINIDQGERLDTLESITDQVLGLTIDPNTGEVTSTLVKRVSDLEVAIGDLSEVEIEAPEDEELSVAMILGNLAKVSSGRKNLAEILGNLDAEVGAERNFASEIGTLQKTLNLAVKQLDAIDLTIQSLNERLTALEEQDINS